MYFVPRSVFPPRRLPVRLAQRFSSARSAHTRTSPCFNELKHRDVRSSPHSLRKTASPTAPPALCSSRNKRCRPRRHPRNGKTKRKEYAVSPPQTPTKCRRRQHHRTNAASGVGEALLLRERRACDLPPGKSRKKPESERSKSAAPTPPQASRPGLPHPAAQSRFSSSHCATPSSSQSPQTQSATALASSIALATATPMPLSRSISTSL